jgi:hypothetical protein
MQHSREWHQRRMRMGRPPNETGRVTTYWLETFVDVLTGSYVERARERLRSLAVARYTVGCMSGSYLVREDGRRRFVINTSACDD